MGSLCGALFGQSQTTSYKPPEAVTNAITDILNRAALQSNQPYPQYTPETAAKYMNYVPGLVAPMSPNQATAGQSIAGLKGYTQPYFNAATNLAMGATNPLQMQQFSQGAINQYMNPYLNDVVSSATANINQTNAQQQQQVLGNAMQRGAFGGDRAGIAQAELARQQGLANNATISNLLGQGYSQAQQEFNQQQAQDLATQLQNRNLLSSGAINLANLGAQGQQAALQQAQAQYGFGTAEQQQQQAALSTAYQQYMNQQAFPYQQLSYYAGLASGAAPAMGGSTTGYTPTVSPAAGLLGGFSTLNALSNAASGAGGFLSLFAAKDGGRINYAEGGRAAYATDGRVPTDQSIIQAYNDYVNAISSGESLPVIQQLYQKYQKSLQGAKAPWETTTNTTPSITTTPTATTTPEPLSIGRAGDKIGGGNATNAGTATTNYSPIYGDKGITGFGSLAGGGDQGGPVDEYGNNPRAGNTPGFGTDLAGGGYGIDKATLGKALSGGLSGILGGVDPTTGAQTGIMGAINALTKGNSPGSLNAVLNAPNTVAYGKRADNSAYPNTSTGMTAQEWADKFAGGDISKVSGSVVNGQIDFFRNDNAVANAVHPGALPASQLSGVIDNVRQPEQTDTSGITDPLAGGADLGATKSAGILGNPYKGMTKEEFIAAISPMAEQVAQQTGLTPQTIMAQTAEETGWGQHMVGNNLFNIKGTDIPNVTTTENIPGEGNVKTLASFAGYENPQKAFDAYGKIMSVDPRYAGVIGASDTNAQINALGQSGYATDSAYGRKVQSFADAIAKMNIAPPEAKEDYSINTPKGVISSDSSSEPSSGIGAASKGHGGNDQTRDTSGDRTVYSSPIGPGLTDRIDSSEGDHVAGVKEESQSEHNEKRGGLILAHPHHYATGGTTAPQNGLGFYNPISMQYGMADQNDLQQMIADLAGSGVGDITPQNQAIAAQGLLPSATAAKGGRIGYANLPNGSGAVESNDDYNLAGNPDLNSNSMWSEDTDTSYLPIQKEDPDIFKRISRALYPKGPLSMAVGQDAKYTLPDVGLRVGKENEPAITTEKTPINQADLDRAYEVGKTIQSRMGESAENAAKRKKAELAAAPTSATGTYTEPYEPSSASGTYTASYDKTQPVTPKVAPKQVAEDQEDQSQEQPKSKNVQVAQDQTRTMSDAAQPGFGYVAPNPADMRNFFGLNYGLSLLSGSSIAAAGDTYAKNILAQQAEQRAQMEAQGRTAREYSGADLAASQSAAARVTNVPGGYRVITSPGQAPLEMGKVPFSQLTGTQGEQIQSVAPIKAGTLQANEESFLNRAAEAQLNSSVNNPAAEQTAQRLNEQAQADATIAQNTTTGINQSVIALTGLPDTGPLAAGPYSDMRYNVFNTLNFMYHAKTGQDLDMGADALQSKQELDKLSTWGAQNLGRENAAIWKRALQLASPSAEMNKGTASDILSAQIVDNKRLRERGDIYNKYQQKTYGYGADAPQVFEQIKPSRQYEQDRQVISTLLKQPNSANAVRDYVKGDLPPGALNAYVRKITNNPNANIERYFQ